MARRSLVLLLALNLLTYMDRQVLAGVESLIARDLLPGDANAQGKMGLLATLFLVSYMIFSPAFGVLGERMSRWVLVGLGTIVGSLATGWTGLAGSFATICAARCLVGVSEAAYAPVAPTLLADLYPIEKRGAVLSWFYAAIPVGSALGYAVGGAVASHFGWRWAFLSLVAPGIVAGVLPMFMKDPRGEVREAVSRAADPAANRAGDGVPSAEKQSPPSGSLSRVGAYLALSRIASYRYCVAGMTAMTFALGGISFWMPRYIHETRGYSTLAQVNLVLGGIVVVTGLLATLAGGYLADKLRARFPGAYFLVSGIGLLLGFPLFLLILVTPFPWAWVPLAGAVFCLFFNTGPANTIIANVTTPALRTTAYALSIFIIHALGDAISPPLIGFIADRSSLPAAMALVALMFLVGGVLWVMGARHLAKDTVD